MKTITVTLHSDKDAEYLMQKLQTATKFEGPVEIFEMDEDIPDEDLEEFDGRMEEFYEQPFDEAGYIAFQKELKEKYGISFILRT
jgi:hypothetical protein